MKKSDIRTRLANAILTRIARMLAKHYGSTAELQRRFTKATGEPLYRSRLATWLHADPHQREFPTAGNFLLLERLAARMEKEFNEKVSPAQLEFAAVPAHPDPLPPGGNQRPANPCDFGP
ncbi:MAG: hypothetical protein ABMA26_25935 [Limisphaerales bacterium]